MDDREACIALRGSEISRSREIRRRRESDIMNGGEEDTLEEVEDLGENEKVVSSSTWLLNKDL